MPAMKLKQYLDNEGIKYVTIVHSPAYTAQEAAASAHIQRNVLAKTVIVELDDELAMVVVPANRRVELKELRELTGCERVKIASEDTFRKRFPDCEVGAMPPFGNLYGMEVFAAASLSDSPEIAFNAGTHTEVVKMEYRDFERMVHPRVMNLA